MKIAVVGSGISGISSALLLSKDHEVTLFEKDERLGGHSHTVDVSFPDKKLPVDTGFMVFNPPAYPNLVKMFAYLHVETAPTSMSFSVTLGSSFTYSSDIPRGVFAETLNLLNPSFYLYLLSIARFNRHALSELHSGLNEKETLLEFLTRHRLPNTVYERHLAPMVSSIWSTPKALLKDFPAAALIRFLAMHNLLQLWGHPDWRTVAGGSQSYVSAAEKRIRENGSTILLNTPVERITRGERVVIQTKGTRHEFDHVVIGTHAHDALALLSDATEEEKRLLSAFEYETNDVIVHSDPSLMPKNARAWASWNYMEPDGGAREKVTLTYYMNRLQNIQTTYPVYITLNPFTPPKHELIHRRIRYAHPRLTVASNIAKQELGTIQNVNKTLFTGSYFGYGFHEDGIASSIEAVKHLGVIPPWE